MTGIGRGASRPAHRRPLLAAAIGLVIAAGLAAAAAADPVANDASAPVFTGDVALKQRLDAAGPLVVGGDRLGRDRLQHFYAAHGYHTVWDSRPQVSAALIKTVLEAASQGLDPALFHGPLLTALPGSLPPIERDLLLTDAIVSYADALARGAYPVEQRFDDEDLRTDPIDLVAALDTAMTAPDPAQALLALAPSSPEYKTLQHAYQLALAEPPAPAGRAGPARESKERAAAERHVRQLVDNLERLRWLPRVLPRDRIVVNAAAQMLQLYHDDQPVFTTRVVVGMPDWQTPEFHATVHAILFNPPWNVPPSILRSEIGPEMAADPDYLAKHHMRYRGPNRIEQEAGPYSALGRLKFEIDDRFDVYLHDTPMKYLFARPVRTLSHGCVRVQNPAMLAQLLLDSPPEAIAKGIAVGYTHARALAAPMPVFIVYQTAVAEADGSIRYLADPYRRDDEIWDWLHKLGQAPIAEQAAAAQRRG